MNKINISNAPAYTSPNSMTLICTEKPDGSTNLATVAQTMDADDHVVHLCDVKGVYGDEDVDAVFGGKVTLNLRLRSRNKKGQGGCLRIAALRFEVAI